MSGVDPISWMMIAASATKAFGSIAQGQDADAIAKYQAKQMRKVALRKEAESQRVAIEEAKAGRLLASRAKAIAGASGAGVDDPSVNKIITEIESQGEYNALVALYEGTMQARDLRMQADATREEGRAAKKASYLSAIVDMGSSLYSSGAFGGTASAGMKTLDSDLASINRSVGMAKLDKSALEINNLLRKSRRIA